MRVVSRLVGLFGRYSRSVGKVVQLVGGGGVLGRTIGRGQSVGKVFGRLVEVEGRSVEVGGQAMK